MINTVYCAMKIYIHIFESVPLKVFQLKLNIIYFMRKDLLYHLYQTTIHFS